MSHLFRQAIHVAAKKGNSFAFSALMRNGADLYLKSAVSVVRCLPSPCAVRRFLSKNHQTKCIRVHDQEGRVCEEYAHDGRHNGLLRLIWQLKQQRHSHEKQHRSENVALTPHEIEEDIKSEHRRNEFNSAHKRVRDAEKGVLRSAPSRWSPRAQVSPDTEFAVRPSHAHTRRPADAITAAKSSGQEEQDVDGFDEYSFTSEDDITKALIQHCISNRPAGEKGKD